MSQEFDSLRRKFLQLGVFSGIGLLISRKVKADDLTDLLARDDGAKNELLAVRLWPSSIYTRLTLEAEDNITAKSSVLDNPLQLIIDIFDVTLNAVLNNLATKVLAADPIIREISVSQLNPDTVRIAIFLKQHVHVQTQAIAPVSLGAVHYKYRYVIDMYPGSDNSAANDGLDDDLLAFLQPNDDTENHSGQVSKSTNTKVASRPNLLAKPRPPLQTPYTGRKLVIVLDPGHGGEDPGAVGPSGLKEKDVVLDIGKRLHLLLNQAGNIQARLTRDQDIFIPLATRVAIARAAHADIFVSIHADAFTTPLAKGSSVFILSERGASSSFARWLAKTQNQADLVGGMSFHSKDKTVSRILLDMTQTWTINKSIKLGRILLGQMGDINQLHSKNVERAGFAVLKAPDIPSVLVETAFISNPVEESQLKKVEFRQKVADTLANGIKNFAQTIRNS